MNVYKANYFLAKGGQSCEAACQEVDRTCDEGMLKNAERDMAACQNVIRGLGEKFARSEDKTGKGL